MPAKNESENRVPDRRKKRILLLAVLFVVLAAAGGALVYWQLNKKRIIRDKLEQAIRSNSDGLYQVGYDSLDFDEVSGYLAVSNLRLRYDSAKYLALAAEKKAPSVLIKIDIPQLAVFGVKTPRAVIDKEISGRKLVISNPSIEIAYTMKGDDSLRNIPDKEIEELILGEFNLISLDTLQIAGADIRSGNLATKREDITLSDVSINLHDVRVDSAAGADSTRLFYSKYIGLSCGKIGWRSNDNFYRYEADSIMIRSSDSLVYVDKFSIIPQLEEEAFTREKSFQTDRLNFTFRNMSIRNVDFEELLRENIIADEVRIESANFHLYRDLNKRRDKKNRVGHYPHQEIFDLPVDLAINKLTIANALVEYRERNNITGRVGTVRFNNANAVIGNLCNNRDWFKDNNVMTADIRSSFLNKASFSTKWKFYLGNPNGRFDVEGTMGPMEATALTALTRPMGPAEIEKGNIENVWFQFEGSDHAVNGKVKVLYNDLKVALLEMDDGRPDKKNVTSLLANFLIKNDNPSGNDDARVSTVHYQRDPNRSIFNTLWKSLFEGISESVGIKKKNK